MLLQPELPKNTSSLSTSQSQPGSGSLIDKLPGPDWTNDIIAFIALAFTVITFICQQRQNRRAAAEQKEKDRLASMEVERLRQQTVRLEWYRDIVRNMLDFVHQKFDTLHGFKGDIKTADLPEEEKDRLATAFKKAIAELRDHFLERILYVHTPTYEMLKRELNDLTDDLVITIFNDELKLSNADVYEREIGSKIRDCQQRFFKTLYTYRGEE